MNFAVLLRSLGTMILLLGFAMVTCVLLGFIVPIDAGHNPNLDLEGWVISLAITLFVGVACWGRGQILARRKKSPSILRRREAMALVGIGWVVCSMIGALPYYFCEPHLDPISSVFESVSGLTTTGATIFSDLESLPKTILLWRSVSQWFGGMGILAMFVVVLSGMGVSSKTLIGAESSLSSSDLASLQQTMRILWAVYFAFTVIGGLGLWLFGFTPFQAVNHILTTVSTGGFGTQNDSAMGDAFTPAIKSWLIVFMLLGSVSFPIYLSLLKRKTKDLHRRFEEIWWYLGLLVFASTLVMLLQTAGGFEESPLDIVFNVVSVSTSTGYVSVDYQRWGSAGMAIILIITLIGGCSGSTAGGLKMSRIILWFRFVRLGLKQTFRPKVIIPIKMNGKHVPDSAFSQLMLVITLFGFFTITGGLAFSILEQEESFFGNISLVITLLSNTGPGLMEFGPTESFSDITAASKLLGSGFMILGRIEYVAILILFSRSLWRHY